MALGSSAIVLKVSEQNCFQGYVSLLAVGDTTRAVFFGGGLNDCNIMYFVPFSNVDVPSSLISLQ